MNVIKKIKSVLRGAKQRWGSSRMKRQLWNQEFANGRWDSIEDTPGDMVYPYVEKYCRGGSILDLGCGSGNTGCELDATSYCVYIGVDISDVAIEKAKARSQRCQRGHQNRYVQSDILGYVPQERYDVILFRESIYYIPRARIKDTLERYSHHLKSDGVLIVRWHEAAAAEDILKITKTKLHIIERSSNAFGPVVMVFRP